MVCQQPLRDIRDGFPANAGIEDYGQQLTIAQRRGPAQFQLLTRTLVRRHLAQHQSVARWSGAILVTVAHGVSFTMINLAQDQHTETHCALDESVSRRQPRIEPSRLSPRARSLHPMTEPELVPDDLLTAARVCRETLSPALDRDWSGAAGDLEWDCRRTLDHIVDTLLLYAAYLASRGTERISPPRNGDPTASPAQLLTTVGAAAAVLAEVARAAPPDTRAFHPAGMADVSGWVAMGCEEI